MPPFSSLVSPARWGRIATRHRTLALGLLAGTATLGVLWWLMQGLMGQGTNLPLPLMFVLPVVVATLIGGAGAGLIGTAAVAAIALHPHFDHLPPGFSGHPDMLTRRWILIVATCVLINLLGHVIAQANQQRIAQQGQREASEQALRLREAQLARLFDQNGVGLIECAPDGTLLRVNLALCERLGYRVNELIGMRLHELTHPDDIAASESIHLKLINGWASSYNVEKRYLHANGQPVWVRVTGGAARNEAGDLLSINTLVEFIDAYKHAEAERQHALQRHLAQMRAAANVLQLNQARLSAILDTAADSIITMDADCNITIANRAAAELLQQASDRLVGTPMHQWLPDGHAAAMHTVMVELDALRAKGTPSMPVKPIKLRDAKGRQFVVEAAFSSAAVKAQVVYIAVLHDTRAQHAMRKGLQQHRATLAAALDAMNDGLLIVDQHYKVVYVNAEFVQFHRAAHRDEFKELFENYRNHFDLFDLDGKRLPLRCWPLRRALRGEIRYQMGIHVRHRGTGIEWTGSASFSPSRDLSGDITGAVLTVRDITERERTARELHRTRDELAAANAQLHRLLAAQRHIEERERRRIARELHDDLQQRLVVIRMNQEMLSGTVLDASPEAMLPVLEQTVVMVDDTIDSLRRIVNDLRPQTLDLLGLPTALEMVMREFEKLTGIDVELEVVPEAAATAALPDTVATNLYRFVQEGLNNVRKHSQASFVYVCLDLSSANSLQVSIADDGNGFGQSQASGGLSTGLQGIAERAHSLGGQFTVNSQPGHGTQLVLTVPLTGALAQAA